MKKISTFVLTCVLILLTFFLYAHTLHAPFIFDDNSFIVNNIGLKKAINLENIKEATIGQHSRMLGFLTFMLNYQIHQLDTFGYRVVNLCIHIFTSFFIWWFMSLLFSTPRLKDEQFGTIKTSICFFAALIFSTHPAQTEAVSFISQRVASLATLFYITSLCFYLKGRLKSGSNKIHTICLLTAMLLGCCAILTKEIAYTLPLTIILIELFFFSDGRIWEDKNTDKAWKTNKIKILVAGSLMLILFLIIPRLFKLNVLAILRSTVESQSHIGDVLTPPTYILTQFRVIVVLLKIFFVPIGLNFDHDFSMSTSLFEPMTTSLSFSFLLFILFCAWKLRKTQFLVSFGIFFFFITISLNFVPRPHIIAEHKLYLTSIGLCIALSAGLSTIIKNPKIYRIVLSGIIIALSVFTYQRNTLWANPVLLWQDVIKKSPKKPRGYLNLADAYFEQENLKSALDTYSQLISTRPDAHEAYSGRGLIYQEFNQLDLAMNDYNKALSINSKDYEAYTNRGTLYWKLDQKESALEDYNSALRYASESHNTQAYLNILNNRGAWYISEKQYGLALKDFNKILAKNPTFAEGYINRGNIYFYQNQFEKALREYNTGLKYKPNYPIGLKNRARVHLKLENWDQMILDLNNLIALSPQNGSAYYFRSLAYYSKNDFLQAYKNASKAISLNYPVPEYYLNNIRSFLK